MFSIPASTPLLPPKPKTKTKTKAKTQCSISSNSCSSSPPHSPKLLKSSADNKNPQIQSLAKQNKLTEALQLLSLEANPSQKTFHVLLLSSAQLRSLPYTLSIYEQIISHNLHHDPFLSTQLISTFSLLQRIDLSLRVFDDTPNPTVFVYNSLLRSLTLSGLGSHALSLFQRMSHLPEPPSDRFTLPLALKALVVSPTCFPLLLGKSIHAHSFKLSLHTQLHIATTLVDYYSKFRLVSYARCVFDSMPHRNLVSWTAMISCYAKNDRPVDAFRLFFDMICEPNGCQPNSVTMVSLLQACASLSALDHGKVFHAYILRKGLDSIIPVLNALVTMYVKCTSLASARRVFERMSRRDVVSWNSMISGYGVHGLGKEAIRVFNEMIASGVAPNHITFVSVLGACSHVGLVEEGQALFDSMTREYGIVPIAEHYSCIVDLLGRAGHLDEAVKIIEMMRMEPGPDVWGALLGACRIHGNVQLAERASARLFKLDPSNAGNYVLLADIYAEAKMWEDVDRVKKLLEARGLQKVPGCSWIEVKKRVYSFASVEELNPQVEVEQLHALLVKLSKEMKDRGYVPDTKDVLYELDKDEKEGLLLGHSEKLAVAFGLINSKNGETIRITKNLRLCEDCHSVMKFISKFASRVIFVRDVNRFHHFRDGVCSCADYW